MNEIRILEAGSPAELAAAARLFSDYAESIGVDLEFQGFSAELTGLPGDYAPPNGTILLAMGADQALGCVALRQLEPGICEMKRMFVAPAGRGRRLGRRLAEAVITRARLMGYRTMRLDTLQSMTEARALYRSLGFVPIAPYCHNPLPDAEFYQLELDNPCPDESGSMRRTDKQIKDPQEIEAIIQASDICRLALAIDNEPYLVPVNFGYDGNAIYLHTATTGRKLGFFEINPRVCFEFEGDCQLVSDHRKACRWTMHFSSVIGYGTISELLGDAEKRFGLNQIMRHYSGSDWELSASELPPTRVWRIAIESLSGKRSPAAAVH